MNTPINNLTLRALSSADAKPLFDLIDRNRAHLADYFPQTSANITTQEACAVYLSKKMAEAAERDCFCFVLEDDSGKLQGYITIKNIDWTIPKCELAYFIDKDRQGQGIMSKALSAAVAHCFNELHMNKIYLITSTDNHPSRKIAEKTGFEVEGILRSNFKIASGALVDMVYYGILRKTI